MDTSETEAVLDAANEGRIRVVDTWTNASDLACKDVDKAYSDLVKAVSRPAWLNWFGINTTVEVVGLTETRQIVLVILRPRDIRLIFKFPPPSKIATGRPSLIIPKGVQ